MAASQNYAQGYEKTAGACTTAGQNYEIKFSGLLFMRAINNKKGFRIATSLKAAGKFDDLILKVEAKCMFLQLKHKQSKKGTYWQQLTANRGSFSILEYYESFREIMQNWNQHPDLQNWTSFSDVRFAVYTNCPIIDQNGQPFGDSDDPDFKKILTTGGKCICFTGNQFPNLKNKPDFKQFLQQFRFYAEQKSEAELDNLIRKEINIALGADYQFGQFLGYVKEWWEGSGLYLTENADFWIKCRVDNICKTKEDQLNQFDVQFDGRVLNTFRQLLLGTNLCIVKANVFTCLKIHQSIQKKILIDARELQNRKDEVVALWCMSGGFDILVVDGWAQELTELRTYLQPKKTLIEIHDGKSIGGQNITIYADTFYFEQLDDKSKRNVLEREINFQGKSIKLNSLVDKTFFNKVESSEILAQVLHNNDKKIGKEISTQYEHYIERNFSRKEHLHENVVLNSDDRFVVTGISLDALKAILPPIIQVERFDENKHNDKSECRHFVIADVEDFQRAMKVFSQLHWIHKEDNYFIWKQSKGGMVSITRHITNQIQCRTLQELILLPEKVKILISSPGIGKSTETVNLANEFKINDPTCWVIHVILNEHTEYLNEEDVCAVGLLLRAGGFSASHRPLLEHKLRVGGNIAILIDGFDEIRSSYADKVLAMMRELICSNISLLWITSRPVMRKKLEEELSCLSFKLQPFTEEDQHNFFHKLWKDINKGCFDIGPFIKCLLDATEKSLNVENQKFTEVPLHVLMLAEAFKMEASDYSKSGVLLGNTKLDLLQLYNRFVDRKWDIYMSEKAHVDKTNLIQGKTYEMLRKILDEDHMACAVCSLLKNDGLEKIENSDNLLKRAQSFHEEVGILDIHRTFLEYFAAKWFAGNLNSGQKCLRQILFAENFKFLAMLFHRFLAQNFKLHVAVINEYRDDVCKLISSHDVNEEDEGGRIPLHLAVINHSEDVHIDSESINSFQNTSKCDIMNILLEKGANHEIKDKVLSWRPLTYADKIEAWSAVDILLERNAESSDMVFTTEIIKHLKFNTSNKNECIENEKFLNRLLKAIANRGYINIAKYIMQNDISVNRLIEINIPNFMMRNIRGTMLDIAAGSGQIQMMQYLLEVARETAIDAHTDLALPWAAYIGDQIGVQILVESDIDVNILCMDEITPLLAASRKGHVNVVDYLIEKGADMNMCGAFGVSSINAAAENGHIKVVKLLEEKGADINLSNMFDWSPIHSAFWNGHTDIVQLLVERDAAINLRDRYGRSPMHIAVWGGHIDVVQLLAERGADLNLCDQFGSSPMHVAARDGHIDVVQLLADRGADHNLCDHFGWSPMHVAARYGHTEVVRILAKSGADINLYAKSFVSPINPADPYDSLYDVVELSLQKEAYYDLSYRFNLTPRHDAALDAYIDAIVLLEEKGADIKLHRNSGWSLMELATYYGHIGVVQLLADTYVDINSCNQNGWSPLHFAAWKGHFDVVQLLAEKVTDINLYDMYGLSPIHFAVRNDHIGVVKLLAEKGADINLCDNDGQSPMHIAVKYGHIDIVQLLAEKDANINVWNNDGQSPIHVAARYDHINVVKLLAERVADNNLCDKNGSSPMHVAAWYGHIDVVQLFAERGADINLCDKDGSSSLYVAARNDYIGVVELLAEKGADINLCDKDGKSPIYVAVMYGHCNVVQFLAEKGAGINICDKNGFSPMHVAAWCGNIKAVKLLLKKGADINLLNNNNLRPIDLADRNGHIDVVKLLQEKCLYEFKR